MSPSCSRRLRLRVAVASFAIGAGAASLAATTAAPGTGMRAAAVRLPATADGLPTAGAVLEIGEHIRVAAQRPVPALRPAARPSPRATRQALLHRAKAEAAKVLALAARLRGRPYVWGAAGPRAFDCSGLVQYVFRHALGIHLPKGTWAQWAAIRHIRRTQVKPGDLVFVRGLWHVGIYAGKGYWWEAPRTGERVKKRLIWAHSLRFGRVITPR